jgi:D-psicose/D-tagatose/L-ribulose 3-epimerase
MKIGFCMWSWGEPTGAAGLRLMTEVAETGYDGIEIPVNHGDAAEFRAFGRRLDGLGLERTALRSCRTG